MPVWVVPAYQVFICVLANAFNGNVAAISKSFFKSIGISEMLTDSMNASTSKHLTILVKVNFR